MVVCSEAPERQLEVQLSSDNCYVVLTLDNGLMLFVGTYR